MSEYGPFGGLVATATCLVAAGGAVALAWKRRSSWEPAEEGVSRGAQRVTGLLSAVAIGLLWSKSRPENADLLTTLAIGLAIGAVVSLVIYGFLITARVFHREVVSDQGRREVRLEKVIGGLWLTEDARRTIGTEHSTEQEYFKAVAFEADRVWPRFARALAQQMFVCAYIGLVSCGTIALAATAVRIDLPRGGAKELIVHVPARSDLGALWFKEAAGVDGIRVALDALPRLEVPRGCQARLLLTDGPEWTEDMFQGVLLDLLDNERLVNIDDVVEQWISMRATPDEFFDGYLRDKWLNDYVYREIADSVRGRPRFVLPGARLETQLRRWNEKWFVPKLERLVSAAKPYMIALRPADFDLTTDNGEANRVVWKRFVGIQLDHKLKEYPCPPLPATGRVEAQSFPLLKALTFPAPNEPSFCLLRASVLQVVDPASAVLGAPTRLASGDVLASGAESSTCYVFGMNDNIPIDNGDGAMTLTFVIEPAGSQAPH